MDQSENIPTNPVHETSVTMGELVQARLSRRGVLKGLAASLAASSAACATGSEATVGPASATSDGLSFDFAEITRGVDGMHHVPEGYELDILLKWGDGMFPDALPYDPENQSLQAQLRQFGYNCDFIGFHPLDASGRRGLLCVNHEYATTKLMFRNVAGRRITKAECDIELAAHGGSVVEIEQDEDGRWAPVLSSPFNRRITGGFTPMVLSGPAAGSDRLKTTADPTGRRVDGTLNNCAGGMTPWGTYLMAEENFNGVFQGKLIEGHPETANHKRYGVPRGWYHWGDHYDHFNVEKEPNEPNRYGWMVEVDILDPASAPKKRTAMGRFKHEGAESVVAPDGRVVFYMGDDQRFEYVYKFVTARPYDQNDRTNNADLLDDGTLYVARFSDDGTVDWLPLIFGEGPLTPENGFASQGDVLIETRRAADLVGATPMDRPEDVEPDPNTGRVYVMLTNNTERTPDQVDAANPRANNATGHIIQVNEPGGDFTSTRSTWDIVVLCGDPNDPASGATWHSSTSEHGWLGSPDQCAIDPSGRVWIASDGNEKTGSNDGLWALTVDGPERGRSQAFFRAPVGAEVCGPRFSPDGRSLFLAVQHPGEGENASYENPTTRWPDFEDGKPPRPSVVVVRRSDGGPVGG